MANDKLIIEGVLDTKGIERSVRVLRNTLGRIDDSGIAKKLITRVRRISSSTEEATRKITKLRKQIEVKSTKNIIADGVKASIIRKTVNPPRMKKASISTVMAARKVQTLAVEKNRKTQEKQAKLLEIAEKKDYADRLRRNKKFLAALHKEARKHIRESRYKKNLFRPLSNIAKFEKTGKSTQPISRIRPRSINYTEPSLKSKEVFSRASKNVSDYRRDISQEKIQNAFSAYKKALSNTPVRVNKTPDPKKIDQKTNNSTAFEKALETQRKQTNLNSAKQLTEALNKSNLAKSIETSLSKQSLEQRKQEIRQRIAQMRSQRLIKNFVTKNQTKPPQYSYNIDKSSPPRDSVYTNRSRPFEAQFSRGMREMWSNISKPDFGIDRIASYFKANTKALNKNTKSVDKNTMRKNAGFGERHMSIHDTALTGLGLGIFANALVAPVANTEANIDAALATRSSNTSFSSDFAEVSQFFDKKSSELLEHIRNSTKNSTIALDEYSQGVLNIYKDGLRVIDGVSSTFDTDDYIQSASNVAATIARATQQPESFSDLADVLGDLLPKTINDAKTLAKVQADFGSQRLEKNFITAVNSSRFNAKELVQAIRNTVGLQNRFENIDTAEVVKLIAAFDRAGPGALRVGTALRRFSQEMVLLNQSGFKSFTSAGFSKSEAKAIAQSLQQSTGSLDLFKKIIALVDEVDKRGKTDATQFGISLLGTEGEKILSTFRKSQDSMIAFVEEFEDNVKRLNVNSNIALTEDNLKSSFAKLKTAYQRFMSSIGLDGGIFSGLMVVFDGIRSALNGLTSLFTTVPILGKFVGGVIAFGVAALTTTVALNGIAYSIGRVGHVIKSVGITGWLLKTTKDSSKLKKITQKLTTSVFGPLGTGLTVLASKFINLQRVKSLGIPAVLGIIGSVGMLIRGLEDLIPGLSSSGDRILGGLIGAIVGFSIGGPFGAVLGGLGGLFLSTTTSMEEFTSAIERLDEIISSVMGNLSFVLDRSKREERLKKAFETGDTSELSSIEKYTFGARKLMGADENDHRSPIARIREEQLEGQIQFTKQRIEQLKNIMQPGVQSIFDMDRFASSDGLINSEELAQNRNEQYEMLVEQLKELNLNLSRVEALR